MRSTFDGRTNRSHHLFFRVPLSLSLSVCHANRSWRGELEKTTMPFKAWQCVSIATSHMLGLLTCKSTYSARAESITPPKKELKTQPVSLIFFPFLFFHMIPRQSLDHKRKMPDTGIKTLERSQKFNVQFVEYLISDIQAANKSRALYIKHCWNMSGRHCVGILKRPSTNRLVEPYPGHIFFSHHYSSSFPQRVTNFNPT